MHSTVDFSSLNGTHGPRYINIEQEKKLKTILCVLCRESRGERCMYGGALGIGATHYRQSTYATTISRP